MRSATIIVPVFNEEAHVIDILARLASMQLSDCEIVIVNDGSTDSTAALLAEHVPPNAVVINLVVNGGKTAAVRVGLEIATGKYVIVQDADLEYDPADIPRLLAAAQQSGGAVFGRRPSYWHSPSRWAFAGGVLMVDLCLLLVYRRWVRDHATCYKLVLRSDLQSFDLESTGFEGCVEITAKLMKNETSIHQIPIGYQPRSYREGKKLRPSHFFKALATVWRFRNWVVPETTNAGTQNRNPPQAGKSVKLAFTLIELLVVIAIVGVLVGILLPAVQMAREAARRMQCQNRLKQIGLAVHSYHGSFSQIPPSIGPWADGHPTPQCSGKGWIVGILPYLEQQPLYDQLKPGFDGDFFSGGGLMDPRIRTAMSTSVPSLHCPSDGSADDASMQQAEFIGIAVGLTNYQGVLGDYQLGGLESMFEGTLPDRHKQTRCNGLFFRLSYQDPQRFAGITDGLSNTYMVGEGVPAQNIRSAAFYANGDYASCHAPPNYFAQPPAPDNWQNVVGFRSRHSGGVQFLMCDGSVMFETESINHDLYRKRSTKAGGSVADSIIIESP